MRNEPLLTGDRNEVLRAVRHVRNRWRLRVALRGIAVLLAAALGTLLASSYGLELFKFDPGQSSDSGLRPTWCFSPAAGGSSCGRFRAACPTSEWRSTSRSTSRR